MKIKGKKVGGKKVGQRVTSQYFPPSNFRLQDKQDKNKNRRRSWGKIRRRTRLRTIRTPGTTTARVGTTQENRTRSMKTITSARKTTKMRPSKESFEGSESGRPTWWEERAWNWKRKRSRIKRKRRREVMRQLMEDGAQIKGGPAGQARQGLDKFPLIYESPPNIMTQLHLR